MRRYGLLLAAIAVLAVGVAVFATSGLDTGPDVGERPRAGRVPLATLPVPEAGVAPSPFKPAPAEEEPPPRPVQGPGSNPALLPLRPGGGALSVGSGQLGDRTGSEAAATTTGRRLTMMENLFRAAARVAPEGPDQQAVQRVLDDALAKMEGLEEDVRTGAKSYRDAVDAMNAARDEAGELVDGILPEDEARAVKLRMGIRDVPPSAPPIGDEGQEIDWGGQGVSLEEAFKGVE